VGGVFLDLKKRSHWRVRPGVRAELKKRTHFPGGCDLKKRSHDLRLTDWGFEMKKAKPLFIETKSLRSAWVARPQAIGERGGMVAQPFRLRVAHRGDRLSVTTRYNAGLSFLPGMPVSDRKQDADISKSM
jgi:hypothetical protein